MAGRFERAIELIDEANSADPTVLMVDGQPRPKELVHAEIATEWVRRLRPDADEALLLAARAHHIRRWKVPRSSYPEGRKAYLRWRAGLQKFHAREIEAILRECGYDDGTIARVQQIVQKHGLGRDPDVQALCRQLDEARANKDYSSADELRQQIIDMGYDVHTGRDGTTAERLLA